MKISKTTDKALREVITKRLEQNKEKYGEAYCPCSIKRDSSTICMCQAFRDQIARQEEGSCHCGLWVATNE